MLAANDIEEAQKAVDLQQELASLKKSAKESWDEYCEMDKERQELRKENERLTEELASANRRNVKHKEALDYIAQGSYTGASHIAMDALGLI